MSNAGISNLILAGLLPISINTICRYCLSILSEPYEKEDDKSHDKDTRINDVSVDILAIAHRLHDLIRHPQVVHYV